MIIVLLVIAAISNGVTSFDIPLPLHKNANPRVEPKDVTFNEYRVPLDHFRPQNNNETGYYYMMQTDYYQPGGPIFFHVSDLDTAGVEYFPFYNGIVNSVAQQVNGAIASGDLRYFWGFLPTDTLSFENLEYLTVDQILEDLSIVLIDIKERLNATDSKLIVFGAGFGGTLATWLRVKYPHLVDGVWSSSGIFSADAFTEEHYTFLSKIIERGNASCANRTREAFEEMDHYIQSGQGEYLQEILYLCSPVNTTFDLDVQTFYEGQLNFLSHFFSRNHEYAHSEFCYYMDYPNRTALEGYANWMYWYYYYFSCIELSYENRTARIADDYVFASGDFFLVRQWYYLKCTQLGMHRILNQNSRYTIFNVNITEEYQYNVCKDVLGNEFDFDLLQPHVGRVFRQYGGKTPAITHAIFTNGLNDPWLPHGILEFNQPDSYVFNITNNGRAADIYAYELRPPHLGPVMRRVRAILVEWTT